MQLIARLRRILRKIDAVFPVALAQVNINWAEWGDQVAAMILNLVKGFLVFFVHATQPLLAPLFLLGLVLLALPAMHITFKAWGVITGVVWLFIMIQVLGQLGYV